ncbi:terminase large subunit domain-containing protein [Escherichia coli]|uniref:terminase large subunit domain-containing protein n=44 Tax=Enterobacterales TaxID=91347 RepID=UPI002022EF08|nr:terminase large subunit [Escherichia coli]
MSRKSYPNVNAANQYARDVVRGKIVACQFVIQACQRHLDDLMAEKSKSFRYRFDKDLAERAAKFIQLLPHTKGEWAFKRMPITLEPWQLFVICCAFGWVNKGSRLRRFREVYTEIPRKNGKSAISAGVALYCFACDNEFGAEVYSGATTEKQAWEVFRPARLMCKRTPMLTEAFGIEVNASNMNRPEDGARFEPLIGNPGDGSSPHCAVVDEYHEHATDALYTTMLTGMGARRQPLMWAITTAGYNIEGPCYDKRREVIEMLNGSVPNDELFGIIYTVDEGDDWTDPQVLEKANPNIGVSVYREFLLSQQQRAKNNARLANVFKTKHLNIWVSARSAYFNLVTATNGLAAIGGAFSGDAKNITQWLGELGEKFTKFADENTRVIRGVVGLAAGLAILKLGLMGVGSAISIVSRIMSMTPIGMIATAIALAAGLIITNWDVVGPYFKKLWETIGPYFEAGWELLKKVFAWSPLGMVINNWGPVVKWFQDMWDKLKPIIEWFTDSSGDTVDAINSAQWGAGAYDAYGTGISARGYTPYPVVDLAQSNNASGATDPNPFMINKASAPKVDGEIKVSFVNSPPGMRVMETRSSGFDVSHDVGYTRFGR